MSKFTIRNGSILDDSGKTILMSAEMFIKEIVEDEACFICGAYLSEKEFNNEHIIPQWILRKYDLYSRQITLPNNAHLNYSNYKIQCCEECNSFLGKKVETPIKELIEKIQSSKNLKTSFQYIPTKNVTRLLFVWLNLLYIKIHLKDTTLRFLLDKRKEDFTIFNFYQEFMFDLHHVHAIGRLIYTECEIDENALGTILLIPIEKIENKEKFDYIDTSEFTMMIKLDNLAIICVLNDANSCGATITQWLGENIKRISSFNEIKLRELMIRYTIQNSRIKNRPKFFTRIIKSKPIISVEKDLSVSLNDFEITEYNRLFDKYMTYYDPILKNITIEKEYDQLRNGEKTSLFSSFR